MVETQELSLVALIYYLKPIQRIQVIVQQVIGWLEHQAKQLVLTLQRPIIFPDGGVAIADVPIPTANVSVTVGVGGNHQTVAQNNGKGAGGVVVVEWVE